jgi:hypothetical protein
MAAELYTCRSPLVLHTKGKAFAIYPQYATTRKAVGSIPDEVNF